MNFVQLSETIELVREIVFVTDLTALGNLFLSNSVFLKSLREGDQKLLFDKFFETKTVPSKNEQDASFSVCTFFKHPEMYEGNGRRKTSRHGLSTLYKVKEIDGELKNIVLWSCNFKYGMEHGTEHNYYETGVLCRVTHFFEGEYKDVELYNGEGVLIYTNIYNEKRCITCRKTFYSNGKTLRKEKYYTYTDTDDYMEGFKHTLTKKFSINGRLKRVEKFDKRQRPVFVKTITKTYIAKQRYTYKNSKSFLKKANIIYLKCYDEEGFDEDSEHPEDWIEERITKLSKKYIASKSKVIRLK